MRTLISALTVFLLSACVTAADPQQSATDSAAIAGQGPTIIEHQDTRIVKKRCTNHERTARDATKPSIRVGVSVPTGSKGPITKTSTYDCEHL